MSHWCGACRRHFSVRMGTVMEESPLPLRKWAIAIYLETTNLKGVSSMKLHRDLREDAFMIRSYRAIGF